MTDGHRIRMATAEEETLLAETVRRSFRDVAERFGLTPENCPRHPSNCTADWIQEDLCRGAVYFLVECGGNAVGCAALEKAADRICYLERLSVLPAYRRRGCGAALVDRILQEARSLGAREVHIGIIADQKELQSWYERQGFVAGDTRVFAHLPFRVRFLSCPLEGPSASKRRLL